MAPVDGDPLRDVVQQARLEISGSILNKSSNDPLVKCFAPHDIATTLESQLLSVLHALDPNHPEGLTERERESRKLLIVLLHSIIGENCKNLLLRFHEKIVKGSKITDEDLPFSNESQESNTFKTIFEGEGNDPQWVSFCDSQVIFCPIVFQEESDEVYSGVHQDRPFPFLSVEPVRNGRGSSGTVSKVIVVKSHFRSSQPGEGNDQDKTFAWKEFNVDNDVNNDGEEDDEDEGEGEGEGDDNDDSSEPKSFERERENLRLIKELSGENGHRNIMLPRCGLLRGDKYYLLSDAADCDLNTYLSLPGERIPNPQRVDEVKLFLRHFQGLVEGLDFLHNQLKSQDDGSSIQLTHLDLKPQNILVFKNYKKLGNEVWKIHDFGISKTSSVDPTQGSFRKVFLPFTVEQHSSSNTEHHLGTYVAPETQTNLFEDGGRHGRAQAESDVWSLGCILCIVLCFLDYGSDGVARFKQTRVTGEPEERLNNNMRNAEERLKPMGCFFVKMGNERVKTDPKVLEGLHNLEHRISGLGQPVVASIVHDAIELLKNRILVTKPTKRIGSTVFAEQLSKILSQKGVSKSEVVIKSFADRLKDPIVRILGGSKSLVDLPRPSGTWPLDISTRPEYSKFSPCGKYLAFFSPSEISFYTTFDLLISPTKARRPPRCRLAPVDSTWGGFDLSSKYLVAYTKQSHFACYIYQHPTDVRQRIIRRHISDVSIPTPICRVAISPDSKWLVYILRVLDVSKQERFEVYASSLDELLSRSSTSTPLETSPRNDTHLNNGLIIRDIKDLKFSVDSTLFTIFYHDDVANNRHFVGWSIVDGKWNNVPKVTVLHNKGGTDLLRPWVTAFIPVTSPYRALFVVKQEQKLCHHGLGRNDRDWGTQNLEKIQIFDVLPLAPPPTDENYIFIGRVKRNVTSVHALYVNVDSVKEADERLVFTYQLDLGCENWSTGRDAAGSLNNGTTFLVALVNLKGQCVLKSIQRPVFKKTVPNK